MAGFKSLGALSPDRKVSLAGIVTTAVVAILVVNDIVALFGRSPMMAEARAWIGAVAGTIILSLVIRYAGMARSEMHERQQMSEAAVQARRQMEELFKMTDMLQSAADYADANAVVHATAEELLPGFGGALYVFNNSRDRLDLSGSWNWPEDARPPAAITPSQCWALKRGKPHLNGGGSSLGCGHHPAGTTALEIPMAARGEILGLLIVRAGGPDAVGQLRGRERLAAVLADSMSLALSNIALREKLRTQALRDPLTGLYNRRYMEDALERHASLSESSHKPMAVIMIDLDHFKRLNDEHGHAAGDAVLRETAAAIIGAIRPSDIACRYGGEELVVILPDCGLDDAMARAEMLRARIESLSDIHAMRITASFGVAAAPDAAPDGSSLIAAADAALYRAKAAGRNRVEAATRIGHLAIAAE